MGNTGLCWAGPRFSFECIRPRSSLATASFQVHRFALPLDISPGPHTVELGRSIRMNVTGVAGGCIIRLSVGLPTGGGFELWAEGGFPAPALQVGAHDNT